MEQRNNFDINFYDSNSWGERISKDTFKILKTIKKIDEETFREIKAGPTKSQQQLAKEYLEENKELNQNQKEYLLKIINSTPWEAPEDDIIGVGSIVTMVATKDGYQSFLHFQLVSRYILGEEQERSREEISSKDDKIKEIEAISDFGLFIFGKQQGDRLKYDDNGHLVILDVVKVNNKEQIEEKKHIKRR